MYLSGALARPESASADVGFVSTMTREKSSSEVSSRESCPSIWR
jgi:hypothetical protein